MPHRADNYEFGPYQLDSTKRVLTCAGETVPLTPKAIEILITLVANAGHLVEKDELLSEIWPDTFVEESNLTQNIFTLRRALGDDRSEPRYIETVTRRGYRFIATVKAVEPEKHAEGFTSSPGGMTPKLPVIAVLPILNATGNTDLEYLGDGVTDHLINSLSRISKLHVMSQSSISRYKSNSVDPQQAAKELDANVAVIGRLQSRQNRLHINVELVDISNGWQLWGENFDLESNNLLLIQDAITHQVLATLKLKLTGDEEKRVTARYTENAEAYQVYLEGRYHWSKYTRNGIEKAVGHFRQAIELDPNYALAYSAIVDCYLRLATNYLPPEEDQRKSWGELSDNKVESDDSTQRVKLRFEWDWKSVQRETKRANELRTDYPAPHQWYAAYLASRCLYEESKVRSANKPQTYQYLDRRSATEDFPNQIASAELTTSEQIQVYCAVVREQIDAGNYEAACQILRPWWVFGNWPLVDGLSQQSCADLLFTAGELAGCVASTKQVPQGQKHGEELLNGSIALFEQLVSGRRAAEARTELALCYYRQGLFDLSRSALIQVLNRLSHQNDDLKSLALIRLAILERHAGRLREALTRLEEATAIVDASGPWATGRCHSELASTYKALAISDDETHYLDKAQHFYLKALYEVEAVGNHRLSATVQNNLGYLMLYLRNLSAAEFYLLRARRVFALFDDKIRCAQVDDSLAQLYYAQNYVDKARDAIDRAVLVMENGDEDILLAEALRTKGMIYSKLGHHSEAKRVLEEAYRLTARCGDIEGAGHALVVLIEELGLTLDQDERNSITSRLEKIFKASEQLSTKQKAKNCIRRINAS